MDVTEAMADSDVQYSLITALRYDPSLQHAQWNSQVNGGSPSAFMLLPYHYDRLLSARRAHGWPDSSLTLDGFQQECQRAVDDYTRSTDNSGPFKVCLYSLRFHSHEILILTCLASSFSLIDRIFTDRYHARTSLARGSHPCLLHLFFGRFSISSQL